MPDLEAQIQEAQRVIEATGGEQVETFKAYWADRLKNGPGQNLEGLRDFAYQVWMASRRAAVRRVDRGALIAAAAPTTLKALKAQAEIWKNIRNQQQGDRNGPYSLPDGFRGVFYELAEKMIAQANTAIAAAGGDSA